MRSYSNDLRDRVVAAMEGGMSCREARAICHCAGHGGELAPAVSANEELCPLAIGGNRRWNLAEVRNDLEARGIFVSYAGVQRTVRRLGLRFKKNDLYLRAGATTQSMPGATPSNRSLPNSKPCSAAWPRVIPTAV